MENAAKALEIAAGVLLGVLLLSLIAYFFSSISEWPQQQDDLQSVEQLAKFNLEYEIYEKSAMYGVDVISCLNKAKSNNEKYVEKGTDTFLTGSKYGSEYIINVYVNIKKVLEETIEIYYFDEESNTEKQRFSVSDGLSSLSGGDKTLGSLNLEQINENTGNKYYTKLKKEYELITKTEKLDGEGYMVENGGSKTLTKDDGTQKKYYSLVGKDEALMRLLEFSANNPKMQVRNTNTSLTSTSSYRYWSTAVWSTALYDFKTRRFTCDLIHYNQETGRIDEIYFSEI